MIHKIKGYFSYNESLKKRTIQSTIWVVIFQLLNQALTFIRNIILARILSPYDFGLIGIASILITLAETFSQTGFNQALIQKKGNIEKYLDTTWTVSLIRGILLCSILIISAPLLADFFNEPASILVIQIMSINILIKELTNVGIIYFVKELKYGNSYLIHFVSFIVNFGVSIPLAIIFQNVWSLVVGTLAGSIAHVILSYILHPYRPRLSINPQNFKDLFNFGKFLTLSSAIGFFVTQVDRAFIGKLWGTTSLGIYNFSYRFSNLSIDNLNNIIISIAFPLYAKLQDEKEKVRIIMLKSIQITGLVSFPITICIIMLSEHFITLFLGDKWLPALPVIQILAILTILKVIMTSFSAILLSVGKVKISFNALIIQLLALLIMIYPLISQYDLIGAAISIVLSNCSYIVYTWFFIKKELNISIKSFLYALIPALISSIFMIALMIFLILTIDEIRIKFIATLASGLFIYLITAYFSDIYFKFNIVNFLRNLVK